MASSVLFAALLLVSSFAAAHSQTCKSSKFSTPNKSFANCVDLPYLSASLHYTFDAGKSTLTMAFTAPPPKPSGWVAWAINPKDTAMAGSQALFATKSANGSVVVAPLDVQSYSSVVPGPISINVSDLAGESSNSALTLFATWHLPPKTSSVNQVWQVGPSVTKGVPAEHTFAQANLMAMSNLQFKTSVAASKAPAASPAEAPAVKSLAPVSGSTAAKVTGSVSPAPAAGKNAAAPLTGFGGCFAVLFMALFF